MAGRKVSASSEKKPCGASGYTTTSCLTPAALYLNNKINYLQIGDIIEHCMKHFKDEGRHEVTLDNVISLDKKVKEYVRKKYS